MSILSLKQLRDLHDLVAKEQFGKNNDPPSTSLFTGWPNAPDEPDWLRKANIPRTYDGKTYSHYRDAGDEIEWEGQSDGHRVAILIQDGKGKKIYVHQPSDKLREFFDMVRDAADFGIHCEIRLDGGLPFSIRIERKALDDNDMGQAFVDRYAHLFGHDIISDVIVAVRPAV